MTTGQSIIHSGTTSDYRLVCSVCNTPFNSSTKRKLCDLCRLNKNPKRTTIRQNNDLTFVGVDGEGVDRPDGRHEYVMLSVGSDTLWDEGKELGLDSILSFLWGCYVKNPMACYVGFFLGYDFIQWEKLLPEDVAYSLLTTKGIAERKSQVQGRANPYPDAVVWNGWEIDIMAGRRFKLRPHTCHKSSFTKQCRNRTCQKEILKDVESIIEGDLEFITRNHNIDYTRDPGDLWKQMVPVSHRAGMDGVQQRVSGWLYICDTGPFWQTSFVNVINPKGWETPVCTQEEYETVLKGKADRGTVAPYGTTDYYEEMQRYNVLENDILARVTKRLNEGFMNEHIPIKIPKADWYGPGRAAQIWMDTLHARVGDEEAIRHNTANGTRYTRTGTRKNEGGLLNADVYMSMPSWFYDAAQASYYGGWFEQFVHGHCGDVWEYDINSAYPYIIATLPCLHTTTPHNGVYRRGNEREPIPENEHAYTMVRAHIQGSNPYIGAMPYRSHDGRILRPLETEGWYWLHEIEAAKRAGLVDMVDVTEWVSYVPCDCNPPFNPSDIGIERMYDLRLTAGKNSPQGKALKLVYNSAYGKTAQSIGSPKYSNPVYASLITAGCRTLILEAIATHPRGAEAVTMVATDGVYFLERHPNLRLSAHDLGAWDETFKPGMTQLMPGVYWDDTTRESLNAGQAPKLKSRGVNARDLGRQIERLDAEFATQHQNLIEGGYYEWPSITFNVGFLLDSAKLALQRGKWNTAGKVTHGSIRKISSDPRTKRIPVGYRDEEWGVCRTRPYERGRTLETTPYDKAFGFVTEDGLVVDRDGTDGLQFIRDLMKP